jgi:hypothetical protein
VVGFTVGNDINDVRNPYVAREVGVVSGRSSPVKAFLKRLLPKSYMFVLKRFYLIRRKMSSPVNEIGRRDPSGLPNPLNEDVLMARAMAEGVDAAVIRARAKRVAPEVWQEALELRVNPYLLRDALIRPQVVCDALRLESVGMKAAWDATKAILRDLFRAAGAIQARVLVVAIPAPQQVSKEYWPYRSLLHEPPRPARGIAITILRIGEVRETETEKFGVLS